MANVTINEGTQTVIKTDTVGSNNYQVIKLDMGTAGTTNPFAGTLPAVSNLAAGTITKLEGGTINLVSTVTTVSNVSAGSIAIVAGTVNAGTVDLLKAGTITKLEGGTVQTNILTGTITRVSTIGTLEVGTISALPNTPGGTLGLVTTVTTVSNVSAGSIAMIAGTITNLLKAEDAGHSTGDSGVMSLAVRVDGGTSLAGSDLDYAPLQVDAAGALRISGTVATGAGTQPVRLIDGTLTEISNLAKGTITKVEGGTIGLITAVTTVSNISAGSIAVVAGTVTAGTITNLLKAEDAGHSTGDAGVMSLAVRVDGGTSLVGADLDYAPLQVDAAGALRITGTVATGAGTQPVRLIDGTLTELSNLAGGTITRIAQGSINITAGTINVTAFGADIPGGTIDEITSVANVVGGTITRLAQGSINVTAGTITNLLKTEDAGHSTGDLGVMSLAVRNDGGTSLVGTDLDYAPLSLDANGALYITGTVATGAGTQPVRLIDGTLTSLSNLAAGTITKLEGGTLALITTVSNLSAGSIAVTAGTITNLLKAEDAAHSSGDTGVMSMAVRNDSGTALATTNLDYIPLTTDADGALRISGTVATGAGTQPVRIIDGTVTSVTEVANLAKGTITKVEGGTIGLITAVTTVSNVSAGSIAVVAGTVNVTAFGADIPGGTIDEVTSVTNLVGGTVTRLAQGSINVTAGTITAGSIIVTAGTVTAGTINAGTVRLDGRTTQNIITFGTQVVGTAAIAATIVGSAAVGSGTSLWVQDLSIINPYGSVLNVLGFGTAQQGTNVLYRGILGTQTGVGIEKSYAKAVNAGMTNQDLVLSLGAAGTVDLSISYFISA